MLCVYYMRLSRWWIVIQLLSILCSMTTNETFWHLPSSPSSTLISPLGSGSDVIINTCDAMQNPGQTWILYKKWMRPGLTWAKHELVNQGIWITRPGFNADIHYTHVNMHTGNMYTHYTQKHYTYLDICIYGFKSSEHLFQITRNCFQNSKQF